MQYRCRHQPRCWSGTVLICYLFRDIAVYINHESRYGFPELLKCNPQVLKDVQFRQLGGGLIATWWRLTIKCCHIGVFRLSQVANELEIVARITSSCSSGKMKKIEKYVSVVSYNMCRVQMFTNGCM